MDVRTRLTTPNALLLGGLALTLLATGWSVLAFWLLHVDQAGRAWLSAAIALAHLVAAAWLLWQRLRRLAAEALLVPTGEPEEGNR